MYHNNVGELKKIDSFQSAFFALCISAKLFVPLFDIKNRRQNCRSETFVISNKHLLFCSKMQWSPA